MRRIAYLVIILVATIASQARAEDPVYFADTNLKACVEAQLGISDPTPTDMLGLNSLTCTYSGITDLNGLEYATNLTGLDLRGNQISDISALAGLTNLTWLNLEGNQISDISALAGLTNLTELMLSGNQISDISAIAGLTNLTELSLQSNQISDISAVAGLTNLTWLLLGDNRISDISAVASLTNLMWLWLQVNQISNISALGGLTNLTRLNLQSNQISNISALAGLTNLTDLELGVNQISNISALAGLTKLTLLDLCYNQISNISALIGLTNLTYLILHVNQISDISALAGLTNLTVLMLENNQISDISALAGLTNLTGLGLDSNQISDISALSGLTNLTGLGLYSNQISDISALSGLTNLTDLILLDNQVSDISALSGLTNLTVLWLAVNQISDISALSGMTNLTWLDLRSNPLNQDACNIYIPLILANNPGITLYHDPCVEPPVYFADANLKVCVEAALGVTDPTPTDMLGLNSLTCTYSGITDLTGLEYATNLTGLDLYGNHISDISPVAGLTNLTLLGLAINQISDISAIAGLTNLTQLGLGDNQISDISTVAGLTNLTWLGLGINQISDISAVSGLTNLTELYLYGNHISDISPVAGLTNLTELSLGDNQISNISAVAGLTNLTSLSLSGNQISDISVLIGLTNLTWLSLGYNQISDISVLAGLTNLTWLTLYNNQISDISAVSGLTNLTWLTLGGNQISDISAVAGLTNLTRLNLWNNQISDIKPLAGLANLGLLDLLRNQISDISPLVGLMNLQALGLALNPLNNEAHCTYLPLVIAKNPSASIYYDENKNPPTNVSASEGTYTDKVQITWDTVCSVTGDTYYHVYRSDSEEGAKTALGADWQTSTSYNDTTATVGTTYYYWVKAKTQDSNGNYGETPYSSADTGWAAATQRTLTISSTTGGSVSTPGEGSLQYDHGTLVSIGATPAANYHFVNWTGTAVDAGKVDNPSLASTNVTVDADYTLQANFAIINQYQCTLTLSSSSGGSIIDPGEGTFEYDHGSEVTLTPSADSNYHFTNWSGSIWTIQQSITITMDSDYSLHASFAIDQRTLTVFSTLGGSVTAPGEGSFKYDHGTIVSIVATAEANYHFVNWTGTAVDAGKIADAGSANTTVILDADYTLQAQFVIEGTIIYVDTDAAGANNGSSWTDAYNYLQDALADANSVEKPVEIRVAQGIYKPDEDTLYPEGTGDREATIQLINDVTVRGGYAGFGEADPNAHDIELYETILSGNLNSENSYHVVTSSSTDRTAVLDGFTIVGGNANGSGINDGGGGMYNSTGSPTVKYCKFIGNLADYGGGIENCSDSNPILINCIFLNNSAGNMGGGVYEGSGSGSILVNCLVINNYAPYGGGMYNSDSNTALTNCTFAWNLAQSGGGINISSGNIVAANCIFWGNSDTDGRDESAQIYVDVGVIPVIDFCCIEGWTNTLGGVGNIGDDPMFIRNPDDGGDGWGDDPTTPGIDEGANDDFGDLRLTSGSPCVDAGDSAAVPPDTTDLDDDGDVSERILFDLDGNPRFVDDPLTFNTGVPDPPDYIEIVDMGAYEFTP